MNQVITQQPERPASSFRRRPITVPKPTSGASKALREEYESFRARADALEEHRRNIAKHRADFEKELDDFLDGNPEVSEISGVPAFGPAINFEAREIRDLECGNLQEELKLRVDLEKYLERWTTQVRKSRKDAEKKLVKAEASVYSGLLELGYLDPTEHKLSPFRIIPGMIHAHPARGKALGEVKTLQGLVTAKPIPENRKQIEELRREIKAEVSRLAGRPKS